MTIFFQQLIERQVSEGVSGGREQCSSLADQSEGLAMLLEPSSVSPPQLHTSQLCNVRLMIGLLTRMRCAAHKHQLSVGVTMHALNSTIFYNENTAEEIRII